MANWNEIKVDASKVASKVAVKTGEIADITATRIRLQSLKLKLCEEYEALGRLTYKSVKTKQSADTQDRIAKIDAIRLEMKQLKNKLEALKQKNDSEDVDTSAEEPDAE